LQVFVRDNNVDQALRALKKKIQREGLFREMKRRRFYEKPSEKAAREKSEAIRRARKLARKQAQREGLIPMPQKKVLKNGHKFDAGRLLFGIVNVGCRIGQFLGRLSGRHVGHSPVASKLIYKSAAPPQSGSADQVVLRDIRGRGGGRHA